MVNLRKGSLKSLKFCINFSNTCHVQETTTSWKEFGGGAFFIAEISAGSADEKTISKMSILMSNVNQKSVDNHYGELQRVVAEICRKF